MSTAARGWWRGASSVTATELPTADFPDRCKGASDPAPCAVLRAHHGPHGVGQGPAGPPVHEAPVGLHPMTRAARTRAALLLVPANMPEVVPRLLVAALLLGARRRGCGRGPGQPDDHDRARRLARRDAPRSALRPIPRGRPRHRRPLRYPAARHLRDVPDRRPGGLAPLAPGRQHRLEGRADRPGPDHLPCRDGANAVAPAVARSAAKSSDTERAVYAPSGTTVEPGRYLVVVDNVCSRDGEGRPGARSARTSPTRTTSPAP